MELIWSLGFGDWNFEYELEYKVCHNGWQRRVSEL